MNTTIREQAEEFLALSGEFRLGDLTTEKSHPVTRELSQTAERDVPSALRLLFDVDADVVSTYRKWIATDAPQRMADVVVDALKGNHRVYFTGCGATGRLSILLESIWREFCSGIPAYAHSVGSVMSGGDYALIKSVEGFEDFTQFGAQQLEDMGVSEGDVVIAITEGGETSFVIGTAWHGLKRGAKVYFVYCNPDDVLREKVTRSREVLDEPRIEKVNLTTGPMAIMGSTRMQATSIQLLAMLAVLELAASRLVEGRGEVPDLLDALVQAHSTLRSDEVLLELSDLVKLEADTYRRGSKSTYFAGHLGIDVLTDTTERSPTFCTPAFRKWDDASASESWSFLILPEEDSMSAWESLLHRPPYGVQWSDEQISSLVGPEKAPRQWEIMRQIGPDEIHRFHIGTDGLRSRPIAEGDLAVCVVSEVEKDLLLSPDGFYRRQLEDAHASGASTGLVFLGRSDAVSEVKGFLSAWNVPCTSVLMPLPETDLLLDGITRIAAKMLLNAHSTCVMVCLGRVLGNCMVAVVPSNLKLIDRSIRYVQTLTGLSYEDGCHVLFESIEYVKPRMLSGRAYPPAVELTVTRIKQGCTLEEAEARM